MSLTHQSQPLLHSGRDVVSLVKQAVEAVAEVRLRQSAYPEVREISCRFREGVLTLRGRVSSYYLKQIAQTLVYRLDGVMELDNRLDVIPPPASVASVERQ